eukprot:SAG11_NODE_1726_length_4370_cov_3.340904_2_plen_211_part_00
MASQMAVAEAKVAAAQSATRAGRSSPNLERRGSREQTQLIEELTATLKLQQEAAEERLRDSEAKVQALRKQLGAALEDARVSSEARDAAEEAKVTAMEAAAKAAAEAATLPALRLPVGTTVTVHGLQGAKALNGKRGVVKGYDEAKGRYEVRRIFPTAARLHLSILHTPCRGGAELSCTAGGRRGRISAQETAAHKLPTALNRGARGGRT